MVDRSSHVLVTNIGTLVTLDPLVQTGGFCHIKPKDLGVLHDAWLLIRDGKVASFGTSHEPAAPRGMDFTRYDAKRSLVLPGFVDCHTHPCFGGDRSDEFCERLEGATYQDIAARGGGIKKTVGLTRAASQEQLTTIASASFQKFLKHGTTTAEAKSGYGLTVHDEVKILRAIKHAETLTPQHIEATCLALHAVPNGITKIDYIKTCTDELLPLVAKEELAHWVDAFVENGYFSADDVAPFFAKAHQLGLGIRLHVDQFTDQQGGVLGAKWGAASCDHLENCNDASVAAMAKAGTVAVLLPGTSLYCKIPYTNARRFLQQGVPVALASDYNPGSCRFYNMSFIASLGAIQCQLSYAEALAGVTWVAAKSLKLHHRKGALAVGHDADFSLFPYSSIEAWIADCGQELPQAVYIAGMPATIGTHDPNSQ